jgi:hypothetical protein
VTITAAIYARKGTDQSDRSEDAKSVTRQVEQATGGSWPCRRAPAQGRAR